jgi:hypothetical protein
VNVLRGWVWRRQVTWFLAAAAAVLVVMVGGC